MTVRFRLAIAIVLFVASRAFGAGVACYPKLASLEKSAVFFEIESLMPNGQEGLVSPQAV